MSNATVDQTSLGDLQDLLEGRRPVVAVPEEPEPEPEPSISQEELDAAHNALIKMALLNLQQASAAVNFLTHYDSELEQVLTLIRKATKAVSDRDSQVQSIAPVPAETQVREEPKAATTEKQPRKSLKERIEEAERKRKGKPGLLKHAETDQEAQDFEVANTAAHDRVSTPAVPANDLDDAPDSVPLQVYDPAIGDVSPVELFVDAGIEPSVPDQPYPESMEDIG